MSISRSPKQKRTAIVLDYPLALTLYRLTRRTLCGLVTQREIVPGYRETIRILADPASDRYSSV